MIDTKPVERLVERDKVFALDYGKSADQDWETQVAKKTRAAAKAEKTEKAAG